MGFGKGDEDRPRLGGLGGSQGRLSEGGLGQAWGRPRVGSLRYLYFGADILWPYFVKPKAIIEFPVAGAMVSAGGTEGRSASGM